ADCGQFRLAVRSPQSGETMRHLTPRPPILPAPLYTIDLLPRLFADYVAGFATPDRAISAFCMRLVTDYESERRTLYATIRELEDDMGPDRADQASLAG